MAQHRRPARFADVIDLAQHAGRRQRACDPMPAALHRTIIVAAEAAVPVLTKLAEAGDAYGVVHVGEALAELGKGQTTRALRILDEILSTYRDSPA